MTMLPFTSPSLTVLDMIPRQRTALPPLTPTPPTPPYTIQISVLCACVDTNVSTNVCTHEGASAPSSNSKGFSVFATPHRRGVSKMCFLLLRVPSFFGKPNFYPASHRYIISTRKLLNTHLLRVTTSRLPSPGPTPASLTLMERCWKCHICEQVLLT